VRKAASTVPAVVPAFEAERTIAEVVKRARDAGVASVLVVDDGSRDATADQAARAGATVLRHCRNRGKGAALWTGFRWAARTGANAVLTMDADGQHDPREIPGLLAAAARAPDALIIGARDRAATAMPRRSRIGNGVSTFFLRHFTGRALTDSQSGFRVYPLSLLTKLTPTTRRFDCETELLLGAVSHGHPIVEVGVRTIYPAGTRSHFENVGDSARIIALVLRWLAARPFVGRIA
jgi:glycosyltransferase involved in cell wall biosynthesis